MSDYDYFSRDLTMWRYEMRAAMAYTPRIVREPIADHYDRMIRQLGGPTLLFTRKFSRTWWRHLARVCVYSFLAEYHRAAGTERTVTWHDPRQFAIITGLT